MHWPDCIWDTVVQYPYICKTQSETFRCNRPILIMLIQDKIMYVDLVIFCIIYCVPLSNISFPNCYRYMMMSGASYNFVAFLFAFFSEWKKIPSGPPSDQSFWKLSGSSSVE